MKIRNFHKFLKMFNYKCFNFMQVKLWSIYKLSTQLSVSADKASKVMHVQQCIEIS